MRQPQKPIDRLGDAITALEGICDLLAQISSRDLHLVDPERFYFTLMLPVAQAREACEALGGG